MIEIFKTNVEEVNQARHLVSLLLQHYPDNKINIDLQDCDRVLRVEGDDLETDKIMVLVEEHGFACEVLE